MSAIDFDRAAELSNGYLAAVCIAPSGDETLWLVAPNDEHDQSGCSCYQGCAPHEHPGRSWPPRMIDALLARPIPRCCRPRADGEPYQTFVSRQGNACRWHGATEPKPTDSQEDSE